MDDGGGMVSAWEAVRLLAAAKIFVNRTIRAIGWVDEESGGVGADQYARDYAATFNKTSFAFESDTGAFGIYGLSVTAPPAALDQLRALAPLLAPIGAAEGIEIGGDDTDEAVLCAAGVPCAALWPYDPRAGPAANNPCLPFAPVPVPPVMPFSVSDGYMLYHHTEADTIDKLDAGQLQVVAAANAVWAASIANLPAMMPRT
jgi:carboxypeptidase Q